MCNFTANLLKLVLATVGNRNSVPRLSRSAHLRRHEVFILQSPRGGDGVPSRPSRGRRRWLPTTVARRRLRSTSGRHRRVQNGRRRWRFQLADGASRLHRMTGGFDVHASFSLLHPPLWHINAAVVRFYRAATVTAALKIYINFLPNCQRRGWRCFGHS